MKYTQELTIRLPRDRVIELFDNSENLTKWQEDLERFEPISGEPGQPGAKSRLLYNMGKRQLEMIETIESSAFPDAFTAIYEANGVWNRVENSFYEQGETATLWRLATEFRFSGYMRLLSVFMRGAFPKQTRETMEHFKIWAERQG